MKEYNRSVLSIERDYDQFGTTANVVSILDPQIEPDFGRTIIKLPRRILPTAAAFGRETQTADLTYLQECAAFFTAGFSEPVPGLIFTPDHAFVVEWPNHLELIAESCWQSSLFYNQHVRCDRNTEWQWRFDKNWQISETITGETFIIDHQYRFQYFHWFMDCLPKIWLMRNHGDEIRTAVGAGIGDFQKQSLAFYGINHEQCLKLEPNRVIGFDRAIVPAFEFVEPLKTLRPGYDTGIWNIGWSHEYLYDLRAKAHNYFECQPGDTLKLFISRADAAHRKLINEPALIEFLLNEGFIIVVPGKLSFAEQVRLFARAGVIIGAHGAGLTNLLWAPPGCTVIELAPIGLRDVGYRFSAQLCGHRFATVLCRTFDDPRGLAFADIEVEIDTVGAALYELFVASRPQAGKPLLSASIAASDTMIDRLFKAADEAYSAKDLKSASKFAQEYRQLRPSSYWGLYLLGRIYRDLGDAAAMEEAFRAAIATEEPDRVGAYFELLFSRFKLHDLSEAALLDKAIELCERSEQKRWYYAGLHIMKALANISRHDWDIAERHLAIAYKFRPSVRERSFLFDWVTQTLKLIPLISQRSYLRYLQVIAQTSGTRIVYRDELEQLRGSVFALEIGAMDGIAFDELRPFLVARQWHALLIEPTQRAFARLVENYKGSPNVRCVRCAVSGEAGTAKMYRIQEGAVTAGKLGDWALGMSSLTLNHELAYLSEYLIEEEVTTITFADLVKTYGINRIDVLQIDTEGHDLKVFRQIDLDKFDISLIHIELINLDPEDRLTVFDILNAHGYQYDFDEVSVTAKKPTRT